MPDLTLFGMCKALTGDTIYVYRYRVSKVIDGILYDCVYERHVMGTLSSEYLVEIVRAD